MRIYSSIVFLLVASSFIHGQYSYPPLVVDSANWVVLNTSSTTSSRLYTLLGDSIVKDTQYYKLYERVYHHDVVHRPFTIRQPYSVGQPRQIGLLREDTNNRKVYGRFFVDSLYNSSNSLGPDTLLQDFGVTEGDSIQTYAVGDHAIRVTTIDTIFRFGRLRRAFTNPQQYVDTLMEGIGSITGGPIAFFPVQLNDGIYKVIEYCIGSFEECNIDQLVATRWPAIEQNISLYPNPVEESVTIAFPSVMTPISTIVFDGGGRRIQVDQDHGAGRISLITEALSVGTYHVRVEFISGEVALAKFIKR